MLSRKNIWIILTLIILIPVLYLFKGKITGLVSDAYGTIFVSIRQISFIDLSVSAERYEYCMYLPDTIEGPIIITNILTNRMNIPISGNLSTVVINPSGTHVLSDSWTGIDLAIDESKRLDTSYTLQEDDPAGDYNIESIFVYGINSTTIRSSFKYMKGIGTLVASPSNIEKTISEDHYSTQNLYVWLSNACNNSVVYLNKSSGVPGDWISFSYESLFLTPYALNATLVNISVPDNTVNNSYYGNIYIEANTQKITIPVIVHVMEGDFDVNVTIPEKYKEVCQGDDVHAIVNITKNHPSWSIDVNMTYHIVDPDSIVVDTENETLSVENETKIIEQTLITPLDAKEGYYTFTAILEYENVTEQASDIFEVKECLPPPLTPKSSSRPKAPAAKVELNYGLSLRLSKDILSTTAGEKTSFLAIVNNTGTADLSSVKISATGVPLNWIKILPSASDIPSSQTQEYLVIINVPLNAAPGTYILKVKALDGAESETKEIKLIIGKDLEEVARLMLEEMEKARAKANESLLADCLDLSTVLVFFDEAEKSRERGLENYRSKNYGKAIEWFEYAISSYEKVVSRVDVVLNLKIDSLKESKILRLPIYGVRKQFELIEVYLAGNNYTKICEPIRRIKKLVVLGVLMWLGLIVLIIAIIVIIIILYRKKRKGDRTEILSKVRERLEQFEVDETTTTL